MTQYHPNCTDYNQIRLDLKNPEGGLSQAALLYTNELPITHQDIVAMVPTGYELLSYHFAHID